MTQEGAPSAVTRARCRRRDCAGWLLPTSRSRRSFTMSNSVRFFVPAPQSCVRVLRFPFASPLRPFGRTGPEMRGPAERREASLPKSAALRRARPHACEAWGVPRKPGRTASRRSTVALSAQEPLRTRHYLRDPAGRLLAASHCSWRATAPGFSFTALRAAIDATPRSACWIVSGDGPSRASEGNSILHLRIVVNSKVVK